MESNRSCDSPDFRIDGFDLALVRSWIWDYLRNCLLTDRLFRARERQRRELHSEQRHLFVSSEEAV